MMNSSYFEQTGFYGAGSGVDQGYHGFPRIGLGMGHYPQPTRPDYDQACKLYQNPQEQMAPSPFKVDCSATKDQQNVYGNVKDMSAGWGQPARPGCTPDPVAGRGGYPPDPSTSPRDRGVHGAAGGWNTCMPGVQQQHHQPQHPQQNPAQMGQGQNATFYPWMALAGKLF